jgi:hypothetical protein
VPYQGRIYIHAEQGDLLVEARRRDAGPCGQDGGDHSCGKSGEVMRFVGGNEFPLQAALPELSPPGAAAPVYLKNKQPVSGKCANSVCR